MPFESQSHSHVEKPESTSAFTGNNHPYSDHTNNTKTTNDNSNKNHNENNNKNHNNNDNRNNNNNSNENNNNNSNENNNNNNNENNNNNRNESSSNSSSSSDSSSSSYATGGNASATGGDASATGGNVDRSGNSSISTTNVDNSRTTFERSAPPVILPNFTNANCSNNLAAGGTSPILGFSFGKSGYDKGCEARQNLIIDNQQKAWEQNFNFQKQVYDDNQRARAEQLEVQRDIAMVQADAQKETAEQQKQAELLKLACDASVSHGTVAHTGYDQLAQIARSGQLNNAARSVMNSQGALTVGEAMTSLKLSSVCADGIAEQLGFSPAPEVPPITLENLDSKSTGKKKSK